MREQNPARGQGPNRERQQRRRREQIERGAASPDREEREPVENADEHELQCTQEQAINELLEHGLRARREIARLLELAGEGSRAVALARSAVDLEQGLERFWLEDRGYYGIGLDVDKRLSGVLASNQGHLLWSGVIAPERAGRIRDALMGPAMFSGWGIRTLAEGEQAYNPVGYHTGSVWPHDNALIASGLRRYGFDEDFERVFGGLLEASSHFANYRLPELFAGFSRTSTKTRSPTRWPAARRPGPRARSPTCSSGVWA